MKPWPPLAPDPLVILRRAPDDAEVTTAWSWKPSDDEFIPDVIVNDTTEENIRYTGTPHLCVEILSGGRGADLLRKLRETPGRPRVTRRRAEGHWRIPPRRPRLQSAQ